MNSIFPVVLIIYTVALLYSALRGRKESIGEAKQFLMAGSGVGATLGFLTFSATLFSTFTLMGMPDFFRVHGVGAWIFLGVTDVAMAFIILTFGLKLRDSIKHGDFHSVSRLINDRTGSRFAAFIYLLGIFLFLVPYVSIQIRGSAIFLNAVVPININ